MATVGETTTIFGADYRMYASLKSGLQTALMARRYMFLQYSRVHGKLETPTAVGDNFHIIGSELANKECVKGTALP